MAKYVIDLDSLMDCIDFLCEGITNGEKYVYISNLKKFIQKFPKEELAITLETFERLIKAEE